jgi:hypothetical protein
MTASTAPPEGSFLATGRGKVTLALLCAVTFSWTSWTARS